MNLFIMNTLQAKYSGKSPFMKTLRKNRLPG